MQPPGHNTNLLQKYGKRRHSRVCEDLIGSHILEPLTDWKRQTDQLLAEPPAEKRHKIEPTRQVKEENKESKEQESREKKIELQNLRRTLTEQHNVEIQALHKSYNQELEELDELKQKLETSEAKYNDVALKVEALKITLDLKKQHHREEIAHTVRIYEDEKKAAAARYRALELKLFHQTEATDKLQAELTSCQEAARASKKHFEKVLQDIRAAAMILGIPVPPENVSMFAD